MGTDIHTYVERRTDGRWEAVPQLDNELFGERTYAVFGFLANVRNACAIPALAAPRGLPEDISPAVRKKYVEDFYHTPSWLLAGELLNFDYDQPVEDRRVRREGALSDSTCAQGEGRMTSYRALLGEPFFRSLERLKQSGAERLVFFFDN